MSNLKIGDVVYHNGTKRKVTYLRDAFGGQFCHLSGFPYLVPITPALKPVVRVTEVVRAGLLVEVFGEKLKGYQGDAPVAAVTTHGGRVRISRSEYDEAYAVLFPPLRAPNIRSFLN